MYRFPDNERPEMNADDQLPLTLPDTQNADAVVLTQSQDLPCSQQQTLTVWGRLCPNRPSLKILEMTKDEYTLGRSENCDLRLTTDEVKQKWLNVISKVHFRIIREHLSGSNDAVVYLEDLSHNGTFVNKVKVGRGNRVVLETNDVISMAQAMFEVYVYMSTIAFEKTILPPELQGKYAVSRKLGSGACGEVKLIFTKIGCKKFAMKTIKKVELTTNGYKDPLNDPEKIMNEVRILKALKHPCVVKMEEIVDTPSTVYIILELMEGGELFDRIKSKGRLSEKYAKLIFYQVVLAVHYLHKCGITHRDLKPENILLASNSDITLAKISDFGLSKLVDSQTMMRTFCGTPMYVAPEVLSTHGRGSYTNQVDVWSLGVILYVCLSGCSPFSVNNKISLPEQIQRGQYGFPQSRFDHVSTEALNLIKSMMTVNPKKRITIRQVLFHQWLQDHEMRNIVDLLMSTGNDENRAPLDVPDNNQHGNHNIEFYPMPKRPRIH